MKQFGLIGYPLTHSFSEKYFLEKFSRESIDDCNYKLFPLKQIEQFPELIKDNISLQGLNVTVPYKESVIRYLDKMSDVVREIGAVNCIKIAKTEQGTQLIGYNTDVFGFETSLKPHLKSWHQHAIILGTGGSAKAVAYVLKKLGINYTYVSRKPVNKDAISYPDLTKLFIKSHLLIINTTPLGMFPLTKNFPKIPYDHLSVQHLLFDLIYNPEQTQFLKKGKLQGATILNGLEMLHVQAEKSFEIWEK